MRRRTFWLMLALLCVVLPGFGQARDFEKDRLPLTELSGPWRVHEGDDLAWADPGLDDSQWFVALVNDDFIQPDRAAASGFVWYRFAVAVSEPHEALALYLPTVSQAAQVFVNGHLIGEVGRMPPKPKLIYASRVLFRIPPEIVQVGQPLHIALRVWQQPPFNMKNPHSAVSIAPWIGDAAALENWRTLHVRSAYFAASDTLLNLTFNLLTALAALALFALRRKEREYLWFGLAQVLWAAQSFLYLHLLFQPVALLTAGLGLTCARAASQFLNLEFFVTLMGQRKGRLYWVAAVSALLPALAVVPVLPGWMSSLNASRVGVVADLVYTVCVPALLLRGARQGNREARLLLLPFALSFSLNLVGEIVSLPGIAYRHWAQATMQHLYTLTTWPFLVSAFNIAGDLAMFSVVAVLVLRYARSRRDEERLAAELEAARAVQHVLIPDEIPAVPGYHLECVYKPAGEVGGDFFQILPLPQGEALIVIGDVSGKGMPAALTVSLLVGMVRMLACTTHNPAGILAAMNQSVMGRTGGGFTTCLILHITLDGRVTAANAGHLAPYVSGNEIPMETGLPLGLAATSTYSETKFRLGPDDYMTLFTDGVLEARRADGELFGFERVASMSSQPAEVIARAAQQFGQEDDITVLSLRRQPFGKEAVLAPETTEWSPVTA